MGHDNDVVIARGNLADRLLALVRREHIDRRKDPGAGVELVAVGGDRLDVRLHAGDARLLRQSKTAQLHGAGDHGIGLAGADLMGGQSLPRGHNLPDEIGNMRVQCDRRIHAGELQVLPVVFHVADVVEVVVVEAVQPRPPLIVFPEPAVATLAAEGGLHVLDLGAASGSRLGIDDLHGIVARADGPLDGDRAARKRRLEQVHEAGDLSLLAVLAIEFDPPDGVGRVAALDPARPVVRVVRVPFASLRGIGDIEIARLARKKMRAA